MTVLNMLIGILCEVVSTVANNEKDEAAIQTVKDSILVQLRSYDTDGNNCISQDELTKVMQDNDSLAALSSLDIDVGYLQELQSLLLPTKESLIPIESVMNLM